MKLIIVIASVLFVSACSIFGDNGVESAPYTLLASDESQQIEIRNYDEMVLVSTSMFGDGRNSAFRKLFKYITGNNEGATEIAMTAPVFMDDEQGGKQGTEIAMTAPVFMSDNAEQPMMSFVMPKAFTLASTPKPNDPDLIVTQITDYKVAAIKFNWTLSDENVDEHTRILNQWLDDNGYTAVAEPVMAGYNGPLTLPWFRHNEVLIQIQ